jgi:hypothetical protein
MKIALFSFFLVACTSLLNSALANPEQNWKSLFDGKSLDGWTNASGGKPADVWKADNGTLSLTGKGGDIWTKERFGDFILEVEFKTTGNSGVFFRTDNPKDNVQTGLECQVENPGGPDKHSVGCLYDLKAPTKNVGKKDAWNKYVITCKGPKITIELNGEVVNEIDLDEWKETGKNPDGSGNKFKKAVKDWKREGHIGFQDHGHQVSYRNVRISPIPSAK